jgi:DNA-binding transcriptional LysR family regulator
MTQPTIRFTLRQLQYFSTVARTGQISLAAIESHVTQSTMTSAIAELERLLGTPLFERSRSGMALTYEGHLFLQQAHAILELAHGADRLPFRDRSDIQGTLQLAASYTVLGYFLMPYIAKFQQLHPGVQIVPLELDRAHIESQLHAGKLELAVALTSNLAEPKRLGRLALARSPRQLWVADGHALAERDQVSLKDITPYPYILPVVDEGDVASLRYWKQAALQPATLLRTTSMEAVREMVALGLGVTILSDMVYRPWSLDGRRIRTVPVKNPIPPMEVGLVWPKGKRLSPLAEAFRDYLEVSVKTQVRA